MHKSRPFFNEVVFFGLILCRNISCECWMICARNVAYICSATSHLNQWAEIGGKWEFSERKKKHKYYNNNRTHSLNSIKVVERHTKSFQIECCNHHPFHQIRLFRFAMLLLLSRQQCLRYINDSRFLHRQTYLWLFAHWFCHWLYEYVCVKERDG